MLRLIKNNNKKEIHFKKLKNKNAETPFVTSKIKIGINNFKFEKNICINKEINYPFIFKDLSNNNYIYYRDINDKPEPEHECTKRFKINNLIDLEDDVNFKIELGKANHNLRLFNFNNKIYAIGGQSVLDTNFNNYLKTINPNYINFNNNVTLLENDKYKINYRTSKKFLSPYCYCPYYANGLYLFKIENNIISEVIKNPIISGIKNGRYDGRYLFDNAINLEQSLNSGITVFDCNTSILYNEKEKKYYLYQRSNLGRNIRYIQYCTSIDLINWSDFNLIKLNKGYKIMKNNIYYNNFFKIENVDAYIAILPVNLKTEQNKIVNQNLNLYYSENCINWNLIGTIKICEYHVEWLCVGAPIIHNNTFYFYIANNINNSINIYTIPKNRFSYFENKISNIESTIKLKPFLILNNKININLSIFEKGYIKVQLRNEENKIINGYSFNDFNIISGEYDSFNYILTWKNSIDFNNKIVSIEIIGTNFKIYSINSKLMYSELVV